jgi:hypothetical protein
MRRVMTFLACLGLVTFVVAGFAAEAEDTIMGNWEGRWTGDDFGDGSVSFQIIAEGKGEYRAVVSADIGDPGLIRGEMRGRGENGKASLKGKIDAGTQNGGVYLLTGEISEGKFTGRFSGDGSEGSLELKRVLKGSPTLGAKPSKGAIILFDGKDYSQWVGDKDVPNPWKPVGNAMEVRGGSIWTKRQDFVDFDLHLEFCTPFMPTARGQGRGNSGVYLPGGNEIQVLDSFGLPGTKHDCGAFYGQEAPRVNACLPPGEWQTYDVRFIAPRFEGEKRIKNASITVLHNGIKTFDNFEPMRAGVPKGGILLQDHGNPVQYRNIWLVPLKSE